MSDSTVTVSVLKQVLKETFTVFRADLIQEMREETRALILASENRLRADFRAEMQQIKKAIILEITEFIDSSILPQIADLQREVAYIKRHVGLVT